MLGIRLARSEQADSDDWQRCPVRQRGNTKLGISFRPRQVEAFGMDLQSTLTALLAYPFELVRLAAYWNHIESVAGAFDTTELDWEVEAAERAGKQIILSVGAIKNFGYPEFFVPPHRLDRPIREGSLVRPITNASLLAGATEFVTRIVTRYRDRACVVAWQLEHEAVDPLGVEHSWRLGEDFVQRELESLREADRDRPVMMNGFLPTSAVVALSQWWRTRGQGHSLAVAARLADIVGVDYYPRHALFAFGRRALYLDGASLPWQRAQTGAFLDGVKNRRKRLMVSEGQAEPWESVTPPPNPEQREMFSCRPADVIRNYNSAMAWSTADQTLDAYLFWGAEYWILREQSGDPSYLQAAARVFAEA